MKKILIIALLGMVTVSCNKKHCWKCTTKVVRANGQSDNAAPEMQCDMTKSEISKYEKDHTTHVSGNVQPTTVTDYIMSCDKQ